jgi:hypothetical protein
MRGALWPAPRSKVADCIEADMPGELATFVPAPIRCTVGFDVVSGAHPDSVDATFVALWSCRNASG